MLLPLPAPMLAPPGRPRPPGLHTLHDVLPGPGGSRPGAPALLIEVLAEVLADGIMAIVRTALRGDCFKPGDQLKVLYGLYSHHGIYAGGEDVIHLSKATGRVEQTTLERFRDGRGQIWVVASPRTFSGEEVVRRARSQLGRTDYDLFQHNCEHFCTWCRSGRSRSRQIER